MCQNKQYVRNLFHEAIGAIVYQKTLRCAFYFLNLNVLTLVLEYTIKEQFSIYKFTIYRD